MGVGVGLFFAVPGMVPERSTVLVVKPVIGVIVIVGLVVEVFADDTAVKL